MQRPRRWWLGLIAGACLAAGVAHAEPSPEDKETARALLIDGRAKMDAKDYPAALKAFTGAHAIMGVPTTGLAVAKAQAALLQLIEARETALSVGRIPSVQGEAQAFADARVDAADLASKLAPRIPSVTVTVKGAEGAGVEVKINGAVLPAATLGLPRKVNPGHHTIAATAAGFVARSIEIDVAEGKTLPVEITLVPAGPPAASSSASASAAPSAAPTVTAIATSTSAPPAVSSLFVTASATASAAPFSPSASESRAWAWIAGGAGLVALGVGVGFFVDYLGVRDTVAKDCPGNVCDPAKHDAASAQGLRAQWNRDLGLAIGLGAVALAGAGIAIVGLSRAPSPAQAPARAQTGVARAELRVKGPGLAVEGAF